MGSQLEYNEDTWNDLSKYIKRKGKSKVDDKIAKARKTIKTEVTNYINIHKIYIRVACTDKGSMDMS